ncbi:uncharacterized protein LOC131302901 [Rhododendron vialii]|uniref:uncharacterized protein LOC131302901 n=1 Tax=Rhododendron vialii TaxID=182163 RepID=UPI00265EFBCC|nr:uncharacterized protein LOC131302901 [Rhododendron vialii]
MKGENGRKPRNAKGSGRSGSSCGSGSSSGKGKGDGEGSRICLLFVSPLDKQMNLVAIDTARGELRMDRLSTLHNNASTNCVGLTALGSEAYAIGGDVHLEEGPTLNGGKPDPVVVTVDQKIYALAGTSLQGDTTREKLNPVFEFLDPNGSNIRTRLPDPPFISLYTIQDCYSNGVEFCGHAVIGFNIYVQVVEPSGSISLYSFNVKKEKWTSHITSTNNGDDREECGAAGSDGLIFDNLRFAEWYGRADVVDYLLYQPFLKFVEKGLKLYAFDLTASKRDEEEIEEEGDLYHDNELLAIPDDYSFLDDDDLENYDCADSDDCATVPVFGLNHVTDSIPGSDGSEGFVAHLRDNLFCFIGMYTSTHHFPNEHFKRTVTRLRASVFEFVSLEI